MVRLAMQIRSNYSTKSLSRGELFRRGMRGRLMEGLESRVLMSGTPVVGSDHHVKKGDAPVDHAPTEAWTGNISGTAHLGSALSIDYNAILAASHAKDADGDAITFTITNVSDAGTLTVTHNGTTSAVVAGTTTVAAGDTLAWTPAAGNGGKRYAFSVVASDGTLSAVNASALFTTTAQLPKVSACATDCTADESAAGTRCGNGVVTLTRSGDASQPLTVNLSIGGTATLGVNYTLTGPGGIAITSTTPTVTFGAHQSCLNVTISPVQDNTVDPTLTVTVAVLADTSATPQYKVDGRAATVKIIDSSPTVSLDALCAEASSTKPGKIVITRSGDGKVPLTVNFTTATGSGLGTQGTDYVLKDSKGNVLTNSITLAAGQRCVVISVFSIDDGATGKLKAKISLATGSGYKLPAHGCDTSATLRLIIGGSTTTTPTPPTPPVVTEPTIANAEVDSTASMNTPVLLSFDDLVSMSGAALGTATGPLQLKIAGEFDGTLQIKHGASTPIAANVGDLVSEGDFVLWTPPNGAASSGMSAFSVVAHAGTVDSSTASLYKFSVFAMS